MKDRIRPRKCGFRATGLTQVSNGLDSGRNAPRLRHKGLSGSLQSVTQRQAWRGRLHPGAAARLVDGFESMRVVAGFETTVGGPQRACRRAVAVSSFRHVDAVLGLRVRLRRFDAGSAGEDISQELYQRRAGASRRNRRSQGGRRRRLGRRADLRGGGRPADRALETRRDVRRRRRRRARRRKSLPLLQPARRRLRRGRAGSEKPGRDLQRFRRRWSL